MPDKDTKKTYKPRSRPVKAIEFSVWSTNGSPVPEKAVKEIEEAIQLATLKLFNDGYRLLTQTTRA